MTPTPHRRASARAVRPAAAPHRRGRLRLAVTLTATVTLAAGLVTGLGAPAFAAHGAASPVPTRAGLDPSLVTGRGATVGFVEQEAEKAVTNGTVIGPSTAAYTLPAEASGRSAVSLKPGQYVQFTLPAATDAITVRYSIPDAPNGGGITAPLEVTGNGYERTMTLTSQYSWLYNAYPFSNDPTLTTSIEPDWWTVECGCAPGSTTTFPAPFRPNHFYDEQRMLLGRTLPAGSILRLTAPTASNASATVIDLLDTQRVGPARAPHGRMVDVLAFGADPSGRHDSADAFDRAIAAATKAHLPVYVPRGTFQVNRHIVVDNVTIEGAGSWYTIIKGHQVSLATPAPDGSVHTGVGFYGKDASAGGSRNVHLSGFAIEGDVRERIDTDQVNGIGGAFDDSTFDGLYIQHTKVGIWLDGPMNDVSITNSQIVDQIADGINFHGGVTDSVVRNNFIRNTGDDALAMWSEKVEDAHDVFDHNTVQTPVLANGIALYGGSDDTVANNLIADPIREGSGIQVGSRFGAEPFTGTITIADNTTVRAGTFELNWNIGLGAIWFYALERNIDADIEVTGDSFLDNTYNAIMLVTDFPVKDQFSITNVHFSNIKVDGTGTSVLSARTAGSASFQNVQARNVGAVGINNCGAFDFTPSGSEFAVQDLGGNTSSGTNTTGPWMAPWELPNTITCDDRPAVVPPPAPSVW
ncbi:mycodextranase [Planctomonas sp. JC2975]|uniref:glycosyl hydrolase family 28-related protein n=1 Tax=Planctomonas sp. JC2975 TaxID=2729626 RepID=UPI0014736E70|nr:glycosyl hydrolase family 28-related protein [Planctomonas sp. JC2975]NNC10896.1 mycodextranase [Planctomonas sp. JC2975]